MRLGELYRRSIELGIDMDPRGRAAIEERLAKLREQYEALPAHEQASFDSERVSNPFGDVRMVVGDRDCEFDTVLTGIQIEAAEILLAGQLRAAGRKIVIIAHHTSQFAGRALASVEDVLWPIVYRLEMVGVPTSEAEGLVWQFIRQKEADLRSRSVNASTLQIAEAVGVPLIAVHTPCDLCHQAETIETVTSSATIGEAVERLSRVPELAFSAQMGQPVAALAGKPGASIGGAFFSQAAGWRPPLNTMEAALKADAKTLIVTSAPTEYVELAQSYDANLISIPHDMIDVRGMRLLYDAVFRDEQMETIPCSNYRHIPH